MRIRSRLPGSHTPCGPSLNLLHSFFTEDPCWTKDQKGNDNPKRDDQFISTAMRYDRLRHGFGGCQNYGTYHGTINAAQPTDYSGGKTKYSIHGAVIEPDNAGVDGKDKTAHSTNCRSVKEGKQSETYCIYTHQLCHFSILSQRPNT